MPDVSHVVDLYRRGDKQRFLQYFFLASDQPKFSRHRYMYDYESLAAALQRIGFVRIERRAYREGAVPDLWIFSTTDLRKLRSWRLGRLYSEPLPRRDQRPRCPDSDACVLTNLIRTGSVPT